MALFALLGVLRGFPAAAPAKPSGISHLI